MWGGAATGAATRGDKGANARNKAKKNGLESLPEDRAVDRSSFSDEYDVYPPKLVVVPPEEGEEEEELSREEEEGLIRMPRDRSMSLPFGGRGIRLDRRGSRVGEEGSRRGSRVGEEGTSREDSLER